MNLYLATGNPKKVAELAAILDAAGLGITTRPATELGGMPEVEETATTFEGNARLKADALLERAPPGAVVVADDSGLEVDALGGQPGVHSARYAGEPTDTAANNAKLLRELDGIEDPARTARFVCCLVARVAGRADHAGTALTGRCEGRITTAPAGEGGFGYDPLFVPDGHDRTFAQLGPKVKNQISHRAKALQQLLAWLREEGGLRGEGTGS